MVPCRQKKRAAPSIPFGEAPVIFVLVKRDPLQVRIAERVRELAQQEFFLPARDAVAARCIRFPNA